MSSSVMGRSLLDDVEVQLKEIRKFVYVATCALASDERNYVAADVAAMLDQVVAGRVGDLLEEIEERRSRRPQGPPELYLVPRA